MFTAAQPAYGRVARQQFLRRYSTDKEYQARRYGRNLLLEIRTTGSNLGFAGIAIVRRTAFQDVGDEHGFSRQTHGPQHFVEQLSGTADKRFTNTIFLGTRRLADDHPVSPGVADTKNGLGARFVQRTARAALDGLSQRRKVDGGRRRCFGRNRRGITVIGQTVRFRHTTPGIFAGAAQENVDAERVEVRAALLFAACVQLSKEP